MQTHSKLGLFKPRALVASVSSTTKPNSHIQALHIPEWTTPMQEKYNTLLCNNTWSLVPLPPNQSVIGCKWIFRLKKNPDGSIQRHKTRLVVKGFTQRPRFDFSDTFSLVVKATTIRIIIALAVHHNWPLDKSTSIMPSYMVILPS